MARKPSARVAATPEPEHPDPALSYKRRCPVCGGPVLIPQVFVGLAGGRDRYVDGDWYCPDWDQHPPVLPR